MGSYILINEVLINGCFVHRFQNSLFFFFLSFYRLNCLTYIKKYKKLIIYIINK